MSAESWWIHCWAPVVRQVCGMHECNACHLSKDTQVQRRGDTRPRVARSTAGVQPEVHAVQLSPLPPRRMRQ